MENKFFLNGVMGVVVGDALGVPVEFASREELQLAPVETMIGYGTYPMPAGTWSDDSSMTLATLDVIKNGYNRNEVMEAFVVWLNEGKYTATGEMFDVGNTCACAIDAFMSSHDETTCGLAGTHNNGNGSLMRIIPVCILVYGEQSQNKLSDKEAIRIIHEASALTHAHLRSMIACGLYYFCVRAILDSKKSLFDCLEKGLKDGFAFYGKDLLNIVELGHFSRLRNLSQFAFLPEEEIGSSGYVVDSLEASIWCLLSTNSYRDSVLKAVNLGKDTDTTAAITGGLAGLYYGYDAIPEEWKSVILRREWIEELCLR